MNSLRQIMNACLFSSAAISVGAEHSVAIDAATRKEVVEGAIRQMNERYVFPDVAKKTEAALYRNL